MNEHFLALKNKYNNEKDDLNKFVSGLLEENAREEANNKNKKHKIEILKNEYNRINNDYNVFKDNTQKQIKEYSYYLTHLAWRLSFTMKSTRRQC